MATAPITDTAPEGDDVQTEAPRDFEADARKMGWAPLTDFKGDPSKHIDAETFVTRGEEMMPILKAQNKTLLRKLDEATAMSKKAADYFSKSEQRAYDRAIADIRAEQEAAVESGDLAAHRAAAKKLDELEKPGADTPAVDGELSQADAADALADWGRENKWYASNSIMKNYADVQADLLLKEGVKPGPAHLTKITERVKAKFPEEFDADATPAPKPRNPVSGGNPPVGRKGGKTFNDLPPEAQAACDKWVKNGIIKDRDTYVRSYQF